MQLSGEIPSTKAGQSEVDLTTYFSNDLVDMSILGSMGGGNKGGDKQDSQYGYQHCGRRHKCLQGSFWRYGTKRC